MNFLTTLREPVSACSHGAWLLLSLPAAWLLWSRSRGASATRWSTLVFCLSLAFCYASSALYHGVVGSRESIHLFNQLDHVAIFMLIAGSYTPLAIGLLTGRWRWVTLSSSWIVAAAGSVWFLASGGAPGPVVTILYVAMGWGAFVCYVHISRYLSHRELFPLLAGGILYTTGALVNVFHWPVLWPGVLRAHDLFHFFVMAGSGAHFWFVLKVVVPFSLASARPRVAPIPVDDRLTQNSGFARTG